MQTPETPSEVYTSKTESIVSQNDSEEDYFTKFESYTSWQSLLLLQFQFQMIIAIVIGLFMTYIIVITDAAFILVAPEKSKAEIGSGTMINIVYAFDLFYFIDWISMMIYKKIKWSVYIRYRPRHTFILIVEFLSMIPLDTIYSAVIDHPDWDIYYCLRLRYTLRLIRLWIFIKDAKQYVGEYSYLLHFFMYFGYMLLAVVTVGCVVYIEKCHEQECNLDEYNKHMGTAMYHSGAIFTLVGCTGFLPESFIDNILFALISYIINIYFIAYFSCDIMQTLKMQFRHLETYTRFENRINRWKRELESEWKSFHKKYQMLVHEYDKITWEKTQGHLPELYLGTILPPIMYKEIYLDMSWVALKHTHLFCDEDVFFLRAVSNLMHHKFFCPGEVIYKRNRYKGAMIYIIAGLIEILSEEDGETPIMTMSAGTVLGEATLIQSYISSGTTISKNVCEVAILYRKDFVRISKSFPEKYKRIFNSIMNRYDEARLYKEVSLKQFASENAIYDKIGILTMKWMKLTLRNLLYHSANSTVKKVGDLHQKYYLDQFETKYFCAKYLNFIAQADVYELVVDSVFIRNTFPFIFKPGSILLKTWSNCVLVLTILLVVTYPYFFVFVNELSTGYMFFFMIVTILWNLDVYMKSSTAVRTKYVSYNTVTSIVQYNLNSCTYVVDILTALTPELLVYMIEGQITKSIAMYACANRLLKLYKVEEFFSSLRANSTVHLYIKYVKYMLYLMLFVYYFATALYLLAHKNEEASKEFHTFMEPYKINTHAETLILCCFGVLQYYGNLAYVNFPFLTEVEEFKILLVLQTALYTINLLFVTTIISAETLNNRRKNKTDEFLHNVELTMESFNINRRLRARVWRYIKLQRELSEVYFIMDYQTLHELPHDLYVMTCGIKIGRLLKNHPLFFELPKQVLSHIATVATIHVLPATEVIKYAGELCTELHILIEGFCSVKRHCGREKKVESGECFFIVETSLNIPSTYTVTALANCKIITIKYSSLQSILLRYPSEYHAWKDTINLFANSPEIKTLRQTLSIARETTTPSKFVQPNVKAFGYKLKKRTRKYYQFHEGFPKWAFFLKYILLRYCWYRNGKFVFWWEVSRCFFAVLVNLLYPVTVIYINTDVIHYVMTLLDLTAYIDIYMRHHFSYFNEKRLEVTHPYKTAKNYWKHAFVVDFLGSMCIGRILRAAYGVPHSLFFFMNRTLQLYRVRGLFKYVFRNSRRMKSVVLMAQIVLGVIIFTNLVTAFSVLYFCTHTHEIWYCEMGTWIGEEQHDDQLRRYALLLYLAVSGLMYTCFHRIQIKTMKEIYYLTILLIFGYLMYNVIIAKVVATSLTIQTDLLTYQENIKTLMLFLRYRKLDKNLKQEMVNHFQYMWNKTKGKTIHKTFEPFKTSFKVEALYNIYGIAFRDSTIFPAPNESFFKSLLCDTEHEIFLKRGIIYRVNDISGNIYLLLRGKVDVVGADGNILQTLHMGSLFGNLDNCPLGRRTLEMVASGHVEVLRFSSTAFHLHLSKFRKLHRYFQMLTIFNVDFLEETRWIVQIQRPEQTNKIAIRTLSNHLNLLKKHTVRKSRMRIFSSNSKLIKWWQMVVMNALNVLTYIIELFHMSTLEDSLAFTILLYTFDLIFIFNIYMNFNTTYEDTFGRIVRKRSLIALRYMQKTRRFYYDLFTVLPFELASLFFLESEHHRFIWALLRFNRLIRIVMVLKYMRSLTQRVHINVLVIRSLFLLTCVILAQVTIGAFLTGILGDSYYKSAAITGSNGSEQIVLRCKCFLHFIQALTNTSAKLVYIITVDDIRVRLTLLLVTIIFLSKIMTIFFIAECCSILHVVTRTRTKFEQFIIFMKNYLFTENVSAPLAERLTTYVELLWIFNKGHQYPQLLDHAPYYLKEAVLFSMFGAHLEKHPIMRHCHKDLMRQVTSRFKTLVLFPGSIIVYMGDIDNCMYFIEEGEVDVISEDTMSSEIVSEVLRSGEMFGFQQGLHERLGHDHTYRVTKFTVMVYLRRESWIYLLDFFPASKYLIYKLAEEEANATSES